MAWKQNKTFKLAFLIASIAFFNAQIPILGFAQTSLQPALSTPFDSKIASCGINHFSGNSLYRYSTSESFESLFAKARTFRYVSDGGEDHWQSAEETEARHAGDCEDMAVWLFVHLKSSGYSNVQLVIGKYRPIDRVYHVWITYEDGSGDTYLLDPAKQKRIWKIGDFSGGLYRPIFSYDGSNSYRYITS